MTSSSDGEDTTLPKTFVLELTRSCNHQCGHCYAFWDSPAPVREPQDGDRLLTATEIDGIAARLQEEAGLETVALSGGEPLLRSDLPEIVSLLSRRGIATTLITNGRLLTAEKIDLLRDIGIFEVTLFSHRPDVHDSLAGAPGAWKAAVDAMANLKAARRNSIVVFVATQLNAPDLEKTTELSIALGAYGFMYNRVNFGRRNLQFAQKAAPTPTMIADNLRTLDSAASKYGLAVAVSVVIEPCVVDVSRYENIHFGWCPLAGSNAYFTIDPFGNLRVCNHSSTVLGNLRRESFAQIYKHHPRVQEFRTVWPEECSDCDQNLKKLCGGGCKAAAEQCYGTMSRIDPFVTWSRGLKGVSQDSDL